MSTTNTEVQPPASTDVEEVTGQMRIDPRLRDDFVVDEVPGRDEDHLLDVKRRIREATESAGRP